MKAKPARYVYRKRKNGKKKKTIKLIRNDIISIELTEELSVDMSFWVLTSCQKDIISFLARLFN